MDDDPESALVADLRALAGPGAQAGGTFSLLHDDLSIKVEHVGGSSRHLTLSARYDDVARREQIREAPQGYRRSTRATLPATRPLRIVLRPEEAGDLAAKVTGLSVEWQSGAPAFDRRVYVETPTADAAVLDNVLNAEVRAATLALMDLGFLRVDVDDDRGEVSALITSFVLPHAPDGRGREAVTAFARILANLPALSHVGAHAPVPLARWTFVLGAIGVVGWGSNVGLPIAVEAIFDLISPLPHEPDHAPTGAILVALALGLAAGAVAWTLYSAYLRPRVQGRSDAHKLLSTAQISAFGGVSVLTFLAALIVGTALAR